MELGAGVVYTSSDLARRRRALLEALNSITEGALLRVCRAAALAEPAAHRSAADFGGAGWLRHLDDDDLQEFAAEIDAALLQSAADESPSALHRLVSEWRATAAALADDATRDALLGGFEVEDLIQVDRPA